MPILCFLIVFTLFTNLAFAKPVSQSEAQNIALNLAKDKKQQVKLKTKKARPASKIRAMYSSETAKAENQNALYYVFETGENGFAIIAGDDVFKPVLGFSESGKFDHEDMPPNFAWYLENIEKEMAFALDNWQEQTPQIEQEWIAFAAGDFYMPGTYLLTTTWNQTKPFNDKTPMINDTSTYTGCVATAMSQIMNYHQYPVKGKGVIPAYITKTNKLEISPVDLDTVIFDWANMKNNYRWFYNSDGSLENSPYTEIEGEAVATLMSIAGRSVEMDYDTDGSGTPSRNVVAALRGYFDYDSEIQYIERDSIGSNWEDILREQIDLGLPVYYAGHPSSGNGHAFILDGYDNDGKFHFNWGWGGRYDGWFISTVLTPGTPDIEYDYSYRQDAIINIMPNQGSIPQSGYSLRLSRITLTNTKGDTISDNKIFQDSAVIAKVNIRNAGTNDFFGKITVILENEFDTEIINEKYVTIPANIYTYSYDFYTPKINSIGGYYKIGIIYTTDDEEYYTLVDPSDVFIIGLYMSKLETSGNSISAPENYDSVDSLDVIFSNIGQKSLSNLMFSFEHEVFASNSDNIIGTVSPENEISFKITPILGLAAGAYKDTLIITGDNGIYVFQPLEFVVMPVNEYYAGSFNVASLVFTQTEYGYSAETKSAVFSSVGKLTGLAASIKEGMAFELASTFPSELAFNSFDTVSIKTKIGLTPNVYIDTLFITGDNGISEKLLLRLEVIKAYIPPSSIPTQNFTLNAVLGDTAKNIALPESYAWRYPNQLLNTLGEVNVPAIYNPDTSLYGDAYLFLKVNVSASSNILNWNSIIAEIPQNASVQFYNLKGNLVAWPLKPGIYIMKIKSENLNINKTIIVKE